LPEAEPVPGDDHQGERPVGPQADAGQSPEQERARGGLSRAGRVVERGQEPARRDGRFAFRRTAAASVHRPFARGASTSPAHGRALLGARPRVDAPDRADDRRGCFRRDNRDRHTQHAAGPARLAAVRLLPRRGEPARLHRRDRVDGEDLREPRGPANRGLRPRSVRLTRKELLMHASRDHRRSWIHVLVAGWLAFIAVVGVLVAVVVAPAFAQSVGDLPEVRGAGSTWSQNAVDQWRADVARFGLKVNYQGVGSSAGRTFFMQNQVDWAISEIPFQPGENASNFAYLPIIAGGTSLMYNLTQGGQKITNLRLDAPTIAGIFTCRIRSWTDPAITSQNPGLNPDTPHIVPVSRSDGSGPSYQFSPWLRPVGVWPKEPSSQISVQEEYGCGSSAALSDGVANYVHDEQRGKGAITYVETSYAIERGRPVVAEKNASGNYVLPTSGNVTAALTKAVINPDRTQNLSGVYTNP